MKRLLIILLLICAVCHIQAQKSQVKVTLRSGVVIKGELKEFNPAEYVIVKVAGLDSKILMDKVESVEELDLITHSKETTEPSEMFNTGQVGHYIITDNSQHPESFELEHNGQIMKMLLVRGGTFNMGYDGDGSLSMKSEPIHQVIISSYYISEKCINEKTALHFLKKEKDSYKDKYFNTYYYCAWEKANQIVEQIANTTHRPYRLLTEAEWEYASLMPFADDVWGTDKYVEWCSDFFAKYDPAIQINPRGPITGKRHVYRSYRMGKNKWDRRPVQVAVDEATFRIAISADAIQ